MKIIASGASLHMNLGGPSIFYGAVKVWRRVFPNCEIVYHCQSTAADAGEPAPAPDHPDIRVYHATPRIRQLLYEVWRNKCFGSTRLTGPAGRNFLEEIRGADLFVDLWGIDFAEKLTGPMNMPHAILAKLLLRTAASMGLKTVHYTASYGPASGRWTRMAARSVLGKQCSLVYCREEESRNNLLKWGIAANKLLVAPDTGLLMPCQPCPPEEQDSSRPCLGISISYQIVRQWRSPAPYQELIANVCDRAARDWNARIILFPNELNDRYDDRSVAKEILERVRCRDAVRIFPSERFSAPQQKGAIAACDVLLASRYHSVVAALSLAVPTVVIGWHHKYGELLAHYGQENMGLSSDDCSIESLWRRCEDLWRQRKQTAEIIRSNGPSVEDEIYHAGERLMELFA